MSTRAQVKVIQEGIEFKDSHSLYHHWDGYPSAMVPLIKKAFKLAEGNPDGRFALFGVTSKDTYPDAWQAGRSGKAASFLCAVEPGGFEPLMDHTIGDWIEWYYVIHAVNHKQGCIGDRPTWNVEIFEVHQTAAPTLESVAVINDIGNMDDGALETLCAGLEKIEDEEDV